jgi:hypothetical protein
VSADDELVDPAAPVERRRYHRSDCGKVRYRSESEAKRSLRNLQNAGRGGADRGRLHVYYHRECRGFHVGHTDEGMW